MSQMMKPLPPTHEDLRFRSPGITKERVGMVGHL